MQTKAEVLSFLEDAGWGHASVEQLEADFSTRVFVRLTRKGMTPATAILMRAAPDQKTDSFVHVACLLRRLGIAAPDIYASDIVRGIVLMEDFGHATAGQRIDDGEDRAFFDERAAQILAKLHKGFQQSMLGAFKSPLYNAALLTDQVTLFLDHYFPHVFHREATARERSVFVEAWHGILSPLDNLPRSLLLRDFMPDNMMALPQKVLDQDCGVLDFQDAGIGCIAYDIASWCEEVRRDDGLGRLESFVEAYHALNPVIEKEKLLQAARIYAAQRQARILGRLVQLEKIDLIPRTWKALQSLMKYEALEPVRRWFLLCRPKS